MQKIKLCLINPVIFKINLLVLPEISLIINQFQKSAKFRNAKLKIKDVKVNTLKITYFQDYIAKVIILTKIYKSLLRILINNGMTLFAQNALTATKLLNMTIYGLFSALTQLKNLYYIRKISTIGLIRVLILITSKYKSIYNMNVKELNNIHFNFQVNNHIQICLTWEHVKTF